MVTNGLLTTIRTLDPHFGTHILDPNAIIKDVVATRAEWVRRTQALALCAAVELELLTSFEVLTVIVPLVRAPGAGAISGLAVVAPRKARAGARGGFHNALVQRAARISAVRRGGGRPEHAGLVGACPRQSM